MNINMIPFPPIAGILLMQQMMMNQHALEEEESEDGCKCCGGEDADNTCTLCEGQMCEDCTHWDRLSGEDEAEEPYCQDCYDNGTADDHLNSLSLQ